MALFWQNLCCFSCWEGKIVKDSWLPANKSLGHWQVLKGNCQNLPLHSPLIPQSLKFSHWPSKPWHSREKTSHLLSKRLVLQKPLGIELWRILPNLPRGAVFVENPSVNRWIFSTKNRGLWMSVNCSNMQRDTWPKKKLKVPAICTTKNIKGNARQHFQTWSTHLREVQAKIVSNVLHMNWFFRDYNSVIPNFWSPVGYMNLVNLRPPALNI